MGCSQACRMGQYEVLVVIGVGGAADHTRHMQDISAVHVAQQTEAAGFKWYAVCGLVPRECTSRQ